MSPVSGIGKWLVLCGAVVIAIGGIVWLTDKIAGWGRLPGDFVFEVGRFKVFLPLATCFVVSVLLTLLLNLFLRR